MPRGKVRMGGDSSPTSILPTRGEEATGGPIFVVSPHAGWGRHHGHEG